MRIADLFAIVFYSVVKCKLGNPMRLDLGDHLETSNIMMFHPKPSVAHLQTLDDPPH